MTRGAADADLRDDGEDDVLRCHPREKPSIHAQLHVARLPLQQGLGGENVTHFGCADSERQRAERAVGAGVAVAADDGHARLGESLLGADDVDDSLPAVLHSE